MEFIENRQTQARLFFPEYFEYLDENTPAHIFNHSIEGESYRYRQCFDGAVFHAAEYDAVFAQACVGEPAEKLCRIALERLRYPYALSEDAKEAYSFVSAAVTRTRWSLHISIPGIWMR